MSLEVITKGKVRHSPYEGYEYYLDDGESWWQLGSWAHKYKGKTIVICVERPEKQRAPSSLKMHERALALL